MYPKEFQESVEKSAENGQYVGLGNPNSKILFIGKEAGIVDNNEEDMEAYSANARIWQNNDDIYSKPFCPENNSPLKNHSHTWQKYQKLHDIIFEKENPEDYCINFVENVFTTELSNLPFPNTKDAKKQVAFRKKLQDRKKYFFDSKFIREFPIVLIFALDGNYISNYGEGEIREIDEIFKVEFIRQVECIDSNDKFWIHHSKDHQSPKLLIHTRQLTNGASNELIKKIGDEAKEFIKKHSIDI